MEKRLTKEEVKELIIDFYIKYSSFEYSLKHCCYYNHQPHNDEHFIRPDLNKYVTVIKRYLPNSMDDLSSPELQEAVKYVVKNPPKKEVVRRGKIKHRFLEQEFPLTELQWHKIIGYIQCIRNNLFHGEKNPFRYQRDIDLLQYTIVIVEFLIKADPNVNKLYHERIDLMIG